MKNLSVELRLPTESDFEFIWELENSTQNQKYTTLVKPLPDEVMAFLLGGQDFHINGQLRLIITLNQKAAGIIDIFNADRSFRKVETGIIILPEFRMLGVAKSAYNLLFKVCAHLNVIEIEAIVRLDNFQASSLFKSIGFVEEKQHSQQIHYLKRL